MTPFIILL